MKTSFLLSVLLFVLVGLSACKKDKADDGIKIQKSMSFDIDTVYDINDLDTVMYQIFSDATDSTFELGCLDGPKGSLGLMFNRDITVGTYQFGENGTRPFMIYNDDPSIGPYLVINGSVTILEHDMVNRIIKGTFQGQVNNQNINGTRTISNGQFWTNY
jgi:hypothetical protein